MGKQFTRRNLLKFVGGSAAGVLLTPIPWKTLDDVAIWTQNWGWIPQPLKGEIRTRFTTCTLCPAGCGARVRCVGAQPVSLSGVPSHPVSRGALCPAGLGGHHLPYHPARLLQPVRLNRNSPRDEPVPVSLDAALGAVAQAAADARASGAAGAVAILDQRPGRTISELYRRFLGGLKCGIYVAPPSAEASFETLQNMLQGPWGQPGFDLDNSATLLSFGAPILDGWGSPGRMAGIAGARTSGGDRKLRIIQVESCRSRTAAGADLWVPINPGTEAAFALGVAHILVGEKLYDEKLVREKAVDFDGGGESSYLGFIGQYNPDRVSRITGVGSERIAEVARLMAQRAPAVAIGGGDPAGGPLGDEEERAIWGLNLLLGSVGRTGGVVARQAVPSDPALMGEGLAPTSRIGEIPDRSIRLLILDSTGSGGSIPWKALEKKLVPEKALIVAVSPALAGDARRADLVIPAPAFMESFDDTPTPADSPVATFSIATPLQAAPAGIIEPARVIQRLAGALSIPITRGGEGCTLAECLKRRVDAIHKSGRGSVYGAQDGKLTEMAGIEAPDKLWKILSEGGCWVDSASKAKALPRFALLGDSRAELARTAEGRLPAAARAPGLVVIMPHGVRGALDDTTVSPLMTKLYQESGLRRLLNQADINPATAQALGLADRAGAVLETAAGSIRVEIRFDPGVMPGVIRVAVGPVGPRQGNDGLRDGQSVLTICQADSGPVWRVTRAKVREA